jgi:hypothetical protein
MISVVGASFTAEYIIHGLYEKSVGHFTEWLSGYGTGPPTAEDEYLNLVAKDYAVFIHETPWYTFPFSAKFKEFWNLKSAPSGSRVRGFERRVEGLSELAVKSAWSWLIGLGTKAAYEPEDLMIDVVAQKGNPPQAMDARIVVVDVSDPYFEILRVPRYQAFTEIMTTALRNNLALESIAGNKQIVLSLLAPRNWKGQQAGGEVIDELDLLESEGQKRVVFGAIVTSLHELVPAFEAENVTIEHIYDY